VWTIGIFGGLGLNRSYNESYVKNLPFGISNVRSLNKAGSLTTAGRELLRYKLDLVGLQEVR